MVFYAHSSTSSEQCEWQELREHLNGVGAIASRLAGKIGLPHAGELIGLAHDLGKYSEAFQNYLCKAAGDALIVMEPTSFLNGGIDHSTAGAQIIATELTNTRDVLASQMLALCVASHHSGLIDCILPDGKDGLTRRFHKEDASTHREEVKKRMDLKIKQRLQALLDGAEVRAEVDAAMDRIRAVDSDDTIQPFKQGLLLRMLFSCLIDGDRTDTADFHKPKSASFRQHGEYTSWAQLANRLELRLAAFSNENSVDKRRAEISGHCRAAAEQPRSGFSLTVPTGGGKTLASLRFALHHAQRWGMDRVVYVSPYISIADQNAQVVREVLEPSGCEFASVVLEHHSQLTPENESWRSSVLAENWDAPVVFTTAVQVLEALFGRGTRSVRRLHALVNAVIVFDEVQTLPVRMVHLFNNAVNFLLEQCGASVVLCTATQPLLHRVDASKGAMRQCIELMPDPANLFRDLKRYRAYDRTDKRPGWTAGEVSVLAVEEMLDSGSCLVIVNTKRDALDIYRSCMKRLNALGESMGNGCFVHLSTRMCPAHRLERLDEMRKALKAAKRVLCVSTQLIEAGVDIDFATVVRDLAALDSIAQAAGRCNRNGERPSGRVHIVKMSEALPRQLEEISSAQNVARRVLDDWREDHPDLPFPLDDPEQMRKFFEHHFFARKQQMDYPVAIEGRDDTLLRLLGENYQAVEDAKRKGLKRGGFMQSFLSAGKAFRAIDSPTQGVIVPFGEAGNKVIEELSAVHDPGIEFHLLRKAQQFSVNLFEQERSELHRKGAIREVQEGSGLLRLLPEFYSQEYGVSFDASGRMESMIA